MSSFLAGLSQALSPGALEPPSHNDGYLGRELRLGNWAVFRSAIPPTFSPPPPRFTPRSNQSR